MPKEMETQGKLGPYKIYKMLQNLARAKSSCVITVSTESGNIRIFLSEGDVIFLDSDILHYKLPAFMIKTALISEKMAKEILRTTGQSEKLFEESLVKSNLMKQDDIDKVKHSIVRTLLTVVMSAEGTYSIDMNADSLSEISRYPLSIEEALFRSVSMQKDTAYFKRFLNAYKGINLKKTLLFTKLLPLLNSFLLKAKIPGFTIPAEESFILTDTMVENDEAAQAIFSMLMSGMLTAESKSVDRETSDLVTRHFASIGKEIHPVYKSLLNELEEMKAKNYFELLSVQIDAPVSEIRGRAMALARRYSTTKYSGISDDTSYIQIINEINALIKRAEEVLTDKQLRTAYNSSLNIDTPSLDNRIFDIFTALEVAEEGKMLLESNQLEEAIKRFEEAIEIHREDPDHTINLIKARVMLGKKTGSGDLNKMLENISQLLNMNPWNINARLTKVAVLKALLRNEEAVDELKEILRLDPDNEEARIAMKLSTIKPQDKLQFRKKSDNIFRKMIDYLKGES